MRHFLEIAYHGKGFSGWQIQPGFRTVQSELNNTLSQLFQEEINCVGCGRTDSGVHASQFFLHFDSSTSPHPELVYKLNTMLEPGIAVKRIFPVTQEDHSRYSATERSYTYKMHFYKDPFLTDLSYECFYRNLDIDVMQKIVHMLPEVQEYQALSKVDENQTNTLCDIRSASLSCNANQSQMQFNITSNRFLYNMIRRIVGLLVTVGRGKMTLAEVQQVLLSGGTFSINFVAPPHGLYLSGVKYPFIPEKPKD